MHKSEDLNFYSSPCPPLGSDTSVALQYHTALNCVLKLPNFISFTQLQGSGQAKDLQIRHFAAPDFWHVIVFLLGIRGKKVERTKEDDH